MHVKLRLFGLYVSEPFKYKLIVYNGAQPYIHYEPKKHKKMFLSYLLQNTVDSDKI